MGLNAFITTIAETVSIKLFISVLPFSVCNYLKKAKFYLLRTSAFTNSKLGDTEQPPNKVPSF